MDEERQFSPPYLAEYLNGLHMPAHQGTGFPQRQVQREEKLMFLWVPQAVSDGTFQDSSGSSHLSHACLQSAQVQQESGNEVLAFSLHTVHPLLAVRLDGLSQKLLTPGRRTQGWGDSA